jgi:hypothetical protein
MHVSYDAHKALEILKANQARHWTGGGDVSVAARIKSGGPFRTYHTAKFKLDRADKVFTIGSCFARNVEDVLMRMGVPVARKGHGIPPQMFLDWNEETGYGGDTHITDGLSPRAFNKYDARAVLHEIRRTLTDVHYPNDGLIELYPDRWFDPHASVLRLAPLKDALANRQRMAEAAAEIRTSKVVLMTLGLTESWMDKVTGLAMNEHPGLRELMKFGDRFQFVDQGYDDIMSALEESFDLIRTVANADMKIIVTVSPVTLWMTFQNTDVAVSNMGSKSVLRAAAGELARRHDFVDYFPSYEMVMLSPRELAWQEDQHHVSGPMVESIMDVFRSCYY